VFGFHSQLPSLVMKVVEVGVDAIGFYAVAQSKRRR